MLILPDSHPRRALAVPSDPALAGRPRVRIGIINIMPKLEEYEPSLLAPFVASSSLVEPVFVRLESHGYHSSDAAHLDRFYVPFEKAGVLDGLLLTGAPVEEIPFVQVHYWSELSGILEHAQQTIPCTLGLCWGGLAVAKVLGVEKRTFRQKLFGVFEDRALVAGHDVIDGSFVCAHSRHSGARTDDLEAAARTGTVRLLSHGEQSGYTVFESADGRLLAHLGHPEYEAERLLFEWNRDRALGRTDVPAPHAFDPDAPETSWRGHRDDVFEAFLRRASSGT